MISLGDAATLALLWLCAQTGVSVSAQNPEFTAASVLPANARNAELLRPGMLVSIYGRRLGPAEGCTGRPLYQEPTELCGVRVATAGLEAELLYAQANQINLRIPYAVPTEGPVQFIVIYKGRSSDPVPVRFAPYAAAIALIGAARVHMPVWISVTLPDALRPNFRYPMTIYPADFGGHDFEVRRNGKPLPRLTGGGRMPKPGGCIGGPGSIGACGPLGLPHEPRVRNRLPLDLLYRFDQPGLYEVRYQGYDFRYPVERHVLARSPWLRIRVQAFAEPRRIAWLAAMKKAAPADPVDLLSDYLPSLVAAPDRAALPVLEDYLYHSSELVRQYTLYALYSFEDAMIASAVPGLIRRRGPTPDLAYLISWRRDLFQPHAPDLVNATLPYLQSAVPLAVAGALKTLEFLQEHYDWSRHPEMPGVMDGAVLNDAGALAARGGPDTLRQLAEYLGGVKSDPSREMLWRLVENRAAREQALIALTWIADPRDLPRLGKYNDGSLDYHLNRAYGQAAAPYLHGGAR